jgi:dTMP kinase
LLINAARYEHTKNLIEPEIQKGTTVICDRFVDSTMAYQGFGHKIGKKLPAIIHNFTMHGLSPDLTFIFDLDPEQAFARIEIKNKDRIEKMSLEFHQRVRRGFQEIAGMAIDRCIVIDATKSIQDIHKIVISCINERAKLKLKSAEFSEAI